MRTPSLTALVLALGSAACVGGLEPIGDDDPEPTTLGRQQFESTVSPLLTAACAGCHTGTLDSTPLKFLGDAGAGGYYDAVVADVSVVGGFDPGLATLILKGEHAGGSARAFTEQERATITEWLLTEAEERGIELDPTPDPSPTGTPTTSREALAQFSACMSIDDWLTSRIYEWADKGSDRGVCSSCHSDGAGGFYANSDDALMFEMNRYEIFLTTFFAAAPVDITDPSLGYQVIVNENKLRAKANAAGHPQYNPDGGNAMLELRAFFDLTQGRIAAGSCPPPGFPEPPSL